ncbi:transglutaminase family protein [Wenzhouxiangella sp. AB-CW3]|uniref:transglutaminase-like domain-containing protein n=1 Tax=Wenzhouxiangella sp. AB-CW3 TaxID=2771012 RepID=UPI00168B5114|nr:transglutaminase family protein [Wenzhouxiangella sp. AB-CW3]QOC23502.1 transglutaminase family protein [Wenzhouxiangella sp. AB-CW3]
MEPDPDNVPRSAEELTLMGQEPPGPLQMAPARQASLGLGALRDAGNPEYLAETPEVVITPAIEAKAAELDHDPIRIYHFVRNQIDFLPGWGATQDAELTLGARRGNAKDTSSLLIALLRASGIPARYVYGVIEVEAPKFTNWMGNFSHVNAAMQHASSGGIPVGMSSSNNASVTNVILDHVWVEAAIDYIPSGGRHMVEADTWVALDASFKQYVYLQGLDAIEISGLDVEQLVDDFAASGTVDEELGYVQNLDVSLIEAAQEQVANAMQEFIEDQMEDPTTGDVLGGRKAIVQERGELTERPDNRILMRGPSWPSLPDVLRNSLRVTFEVDHLTGQPQGGVVLPWAQVNNHRLTMSYRPTTEADEQALLALLPEGEITDLDQLPQTLPGHSISLTPEIKLNGEIILTGPSAVNAFTLETMLAFEVQQVAGNTKWAIPFHAPVPKGSYVAIMSNAGSVSTHALEAAQQRAEDAQYILENELEDQYDEIDRERLMGELFYAGVLAYHAQLEGLGGLMAAQMGAEYRTNLSVGTYGYQPWVRYVYGMPMALDAGGVHMDLDYVPSHLTKHNGSASQRIEAAQPLGMLKSILENVVPEQQFSTEEEPAEGVSAVAAIAKAQAEGQRVFHVTQDNLNEVMAEVSISQASREDIQRAVSQFGYEAVVHEAPITVPGWRGSGYILTDPETGAGSYMIDGGKNGAFVVLMAGLGTALLIGGVFLMIFAPIMGFLMGLAAAIIGAIAMGVAIETVITDPEADWGDLLSGVLLGAALVAVLALVAKFLAGLMATITAQIALEAFSVMLGAIGALLEQLRRLSEDNDRHKGRVLS